MTKKQRILALADGTLPKEQFAAAAGTSVQYVKNVLHAEGIHCGYRRKNSKPERDRAVVAARRRGERMHIIAAQFGISPARVSQIISRGID